MAKSYGGIGNRFEFLLLLHVMECQDNGIFYDFWNLNCKYGQMGHTVKNKSVVALAKSVIVN